MGHVVNDNRASGGILEEFDSKSCPHCQAVINMTTWKKEGGYCFKCDAPICHPCWGLMQKYGCTPFLRQVDLVLGGKRHQSLEDIVRQTKFVVSRPAIKFFGTKGGDA